MKFIIDMNLSPDWCPALEAIGQQAVHWSTLGAPDADDVEIAEFARANRFVIITNDLDFGRLLSSDRAPLPSVIQIRLGDLRPRTLIETLRQTIEATKSDLEAGALVTVGASRVRIASLPLTDDGAP